MEKLKLTPPLKNAIIAQCFGGHIEFILTSGFLFAYFVTLGYSSENALLFLASQGLFRFLTPVFAAYLSDRSSRKKWSVYGQAASIAGFLILIPAGFAPTPLRHLLIGVGLSLYSIGFLFFSTNWFALLSQHLSADIRGRFFGVLRVSWQVVGILLTTCITLVLRHRESIGVFQCFLLGFALLLFFRILFFIRIPEVDAGPAPAAGFSDALRNAAVIPRFLPFNAYVFLLTLFTGATPMLLNALEKEILGFDNGHIVFLSNLLFAGSLAGFFLGGRLVDRFGTKPVFMVCHFAYGVIFVAVLGRHFMPFSLPVWMAVLTLLFGFVQAASSIAVTSELLGLIPSGSRSMAVAFNLSLISAGGALAVYVPVQGLKLKLFAPAWTAFGRTFTPYDTVFLGCAVMVVVLVVALGLVPSVLRKAQSLAGNSQ